VWISVTRLKNIPNFQLREPSYLRTIETFGTVDYGGQLTWESFLSSGLELVHVASRLGPFLNLCVNMAFPYQCLEAFGDILFAASLSRLDLFSLKDGSQLSSWTCLNLPEEIASLEMENDEWPTRCIQEGEPPAKKIKSLNHDMDREKTACGPDRFSASRPAVPYNGPIFIALSSARSGHIVGVTAEDKSIRVFEHDARTGKLQQISHR
jgi:hypothetical protein